MDEGRWRAEDAEAEKVEQGNRGQDTELSPWDSPGRDALRCLRRTLKSEVREEIEKFRHRLAEILRFAGFDLEGSFLDLTEKKDLYILRP